MKWSLSRRLTLPPTAGASSRTKSPVRYGTTGASALKSRLGWGIEQACTFYLNCGVVYLRDFFFSKVEYNCFTMLLSFSCTAKWISYVCTYIPPLWAITEHRAELPGLYSSFPLALCFIHMYLQDFLICLSLRLLEACLSFSVNFVGTRSVENLCPL